MDSSEILHDLDGVVYRHADFASSSAGVHPLESGHHTGHGGPVEEKLSFSPTVLGPHSPVEVEEGLDEVSIDEPLAGLVLLVAGE